MNQNQDLPKLGTSAEMLKLLGLEVTERTLLHWRRRNYGPPAYKVGRKVLYDLPGALEWAQTQPAR